MGWNTVKHPLLISKGKKPRKGSVGICPCGKEFYRKPHTTSKFCSYVCYWTDMKGRPAKNKGVAYPQLKGSNNPSWKEDVGYSGVHRWLYRNFGKADHCENCGVLNSRRYEWALKKGKQYEKKRDNFWQLCSKCHHAYDDILNRGWLTRRKTLL